MKLRSKHYTEEAPLRKGAQVRVIQAGPKAQPVVGTLVAFDERRVVLKTRRGRVEIDQYIEIEVV